jgi:hypothetical protein
MFLNNSKAYDLSSCIVNSTFSKEDYFVKKNNCLYRVYQIRNLEIDKLYDALSKDKENFKCLISYEEEGDNVLNNERYFISSDNKFSKYGTFEYLDKDSPKFIIIDLFSIGTAHIHIPNTEEYSKYESLFALIRKFSVESAGKVYIFLSDGPDLYLEPIDVEKTNGDILENYNDDFGEPHERIVKHLSGKKKGIVLLHGEPGSGKTYYLRHLTHLVKKKFIWLPADMSGGLTSSNFLTTLKNQCKNSVLILEDSEKYLQKRDSGLDTSMYISNILNITDGLMSDVLKIQLICTFNCDESFIDPAILRSGRLIEKYKFGIGVNSKHLCKLKRFLDGLLRISAMQGIVRCCDV